MVAGPPSGAVEPCSRNAAPTCVSSVWGTLCPGRLPFRWLFSQPHRDPFKGCFSYVFKKVAQWENFVVFSSIIKSVNKRSREARGSEGRWRGRSRRAEGAARPHSSRSAARLPHTATLGLGDLAQSSRSPAPCSRDGARMPGPSSVRRQRFLGSQEGRFVCCEPSPALSPWVGGQSPPNGAGPVLSHREVQGRCL